MKLEELVNAAGVNRLVGFFFFFFVIYFKNYGILRFFFFPCFRTPADQIFASCMKDPRPVQALSIHQAGTGGGGEGDDDDDDIEDLTGVTDFYFLNLKYLFLEISFQ